MGEPAAVGGGGLLGAQESPRTVVLQVKAVCRCCVGESRGVGLLSWSAWPWGAGSLHRQRVQAQRPHRPPWLRLSSVLVCKKGSVVAVAAPPHATGHQGAWPDPGSFVRWHLLAFHGDTRCCGRGQHLDPAQRGLSSSTFPWGHAPCAEGPLLSLRAPRVFVHRAQGQGGARSCGRWPRAPASPCRVLRLKESDEDVGRGFAEEPLLLLAGNELLHLQQGPM